MWTGLRRRWNRKHEGSRPIQLSNEQTYFAMRRTIERNTYHLAHKLVNTRTYTQIRLTVFVATIAIGRIQTKLIHGVQFISEIFTCAIKYEIGVRSVCLSVRICVVDMHRNFSQHFILVRNLVCGNRTSHAIRQCTRHHSVACNSE